jgi:hypothetical protein
LRARRGNPVAGNATAASRETVASARLLAMTRPCRRINKDSPMASIELTMLSPLPVYLDESTSGSALAPRPATLDGKVVGLLPNWRPSAVEVLAALGKLLQERYRIQAVVMEQPVREIPLKGGRLIDTMREKLDDFAKRVDVALTATGD